MMSLRGRWAAPAILAGLLAALPAVPVAADDVPEPAAKDSPAFMQPEEVTLLAKVEPKEAKVGDVVTYSVTARVKKPWHIYAYAAERPEDAAAIPTSFDFFDRAGLDPIEDQDWTPSEKPAPPPKIGGVIAYDYHEGEVTWTRKLRVPAGVKPGVVVLRNQVTFQICNDNSCKPPTRRTVEPVTLTIVDPEPQAALARPWALLASLIVAPPQAEEGPQPKLKDSPPFIRPKEAEFSTAIEPVEAKPGDTVDYKVTIKLAPTWHVYAVADEVPPGAAAVPTSFDLFDLEGLEPAGDWSPSKEPHKPDPDSPVLSFDFFEDEVTWTLPLKVPADAEGGEKSIASQIQFQICDPRSCKPPARVTLPSAVLTVLAEAGASSAPAAEPTGPVAGSTEPAAADEPDAEAPVAAVAGAAQEKIDQGLAAFIAWSALGGVVALLMPCVWPMIPITVNFFVKQGQNQKGKSTTGLAVTYCLAIIGVFTLVGVICSAIFGPTALNQLSNRPWLNFLVAGLFLAFGLSLLGLFEIRLPSFLLNASAKGESKGGYVGVFFMAMTLTITSFTCTFPVVGGLLVLAAGGSYLYPVIGLATFATVLALPFFVLAMAPGVLSNLPRSGDWMNAVKVVGGLVEIGAALKFLNTAEVSLHGNPDLAWFDAQVLLASWIVIAAVCGFYLLGFFRTSHDHDAPSVGVGRLLFGTMFLGLALYFSPALFGYPPRSQIYDRLVVGLLPADADELDAETQLLVRLEQMGMNAPAGGAPAAPELIAGSDDPEEVQRARNLHGVWWDMSYDVALAKAKEADRPVLIDFTGVNCANCRLMEKSVMPRDEVIERLRQFVTVQLYVDRVPVEGLGAERSEELAIRNLKREIDMTKESTQPLYVVVTPAGDVVASHGGYIEPPQFVGFLDRALAEYAEVAEVARAR